MAEYYQGIPYPANHPYDQDNLDDMLAQASELTYSERYGGGWGVTAVDCALSYDKATEVEAVLSALLYARDLQREQERKYEQLTGESYVPF